VLVAIQPIRNHKFYSRAEWQSTKNLLFINTRANNMNNNNFFTVLARQLSSNMNGCACETEDTEMGFNRQLFFKTFTGFWEDDNVADSNSLVTSFYPTQDCKDAIYQRAGKFETLYVCERQPPQQHITSFFPPISYSTF